MRSESELVTGDAVVLDLRLARSASRALGYALDLLVQLASLVLVLLVLVLTPAPTDTAFVLAVVTAVQLSVLVGYPTLMETLTRGRTLGKMALGLRVVREDGGPVTVRHALIRALAGAFVDFGPFGAWSVVGFVTSLSSAKGKRLGDYLAGTVVVRERAPRSATPAEVAMPPALASWASTLDLSGLPDDVALSARQYLGRWRELDPASRDRIGASLAADVSRHVGAPVPPGVPAWAYLAAVLAERRGRARARGDSPWSPSAVPPGGPAPEGGASRYGAAYGGVSHGGVSHEGASHGGATADDAGQGHPGHRDTADDEPPGPFTPPG